MSRMIVGVGGVRVVGAFWELVGLLGIGIECIVVDSWYEKQKRIARS